MSALMTVSGSRKERSAPARNCFCRRSASSMGSKSLSPAKRSTSQLASTPRSVPQTEKIRIR